MENEDENCAQEQHYKKGQRQKTDSRIHSNAGTIRSIIHTLISLIASNVVILNDSIIDNGHNRITGLIGSIINLVIRTVGNAQRAAD